MNILFLDSVDRWTFGGYQNWISLLAPALVKKGYDITVAGRPDSSFIRRLRNQKPSPRIMEIAISGDFNPATIYRINRYLDEAAIDIVICDFNKDVRLGGLAARLNGRTRVLWRLGLNITKNSFMHRFLTPKLIDAVAVPSEGLKKQVVASGYISANQVTVIPHGVPDTVKKWTGDNARRELREKYNLPGDAIVCVTSGRFVEQKGHRYLLEAAPVVLEKSPQCKFLFLGDGPLEDNLKSRMKELSILESFIFGGMLDDFELELAGADIMVHPSIEEPFGFSIIEGMRARLPVIASRVGGIPEVVIDGETGILIESKSPEKITGALLDLLESPEKLKAMAGAGYNRWHDNFRLEIMVDRWENYLLKLVNEEKSDEPA